MTQRIVILGAGFGGLELSTILSEQAADVAEVTLIDRSDAFVFGFSKLDVLFGRTTADRVRLPYAEFVKPGVRFVQDTITGIDPDTRRVTTTRGTYDADVLVVALGAAYDHAATPGLSVDDEFYSVAGAAGLRERVAGFRSGSAVSWRPVFIGTAFFRFSSLFASASGL